MKSRSATFCCDFLPLSIYYSSETFCINPFLYPKHVYHINGHLFSPLKPFHMTLQIIMKSNCFPLWRTYRSTNKLLLWTENLLAPSDFFKLVGKFTIFVIDFPNFYQLCSKQLFCKIFAIKSGLQIISNIEISN